MNDLDGLIRSTAEKYGIDPVVFRELVRAESGGNPRAVSRSGAKGLTQLMPGTAKEVGVSDPFDPVQSLEGGARYFRRMLDLNKGDTRLALASYNAGPGNVQKYGGIPPFAETQNYVKKIMGAVGGSEPLSRKVESGMPSQPAKQDDEILQLTSLDDSWKPSTPKGSVEAIGSGFLGGMARTGGSKQRFAGAGGVGDMVASILGGQAPAKIDLVSDADLGMSSPSESPQRVGSVTPSGEKVSIVDIGKLFQKYGVTVKEHPEFGGVGKHSSNSHHYGGNALDLTLWDPKFDKNYKEKTALLGEIGRKIFPEAEIFHPGHDPVGGHNTHKHFALPSGGATMSQYRALEQALRRFG